MFMESNDTVFYLGKKQEPPADEKPSSEKAFRTAYGGALPFALEKAEDKWNTPENMERVKILSKKCERRSMIVRRLIDLERRQMNIITAMTGMGKRHSASKKYSNMPIVTAIYITGLALLIIFIVQGLNILPAIIIFALLTGFFFFALKHDQAIIESRHAELSAKLREIEEEHENLEKEREELNREIKELTDTRAL